MSIAENYRIIRDRMGEACARAGRSVDEVTLLAVTKFVPVERIAEAIAAGADHVGENRVQELTQKLEFFNNSGCRVHFIGQLQTNKVKYIIGKVHLIQSVDRPALAMELQRQAAARGVEQDVLIEVNIGGEEQKGGIACGELSEFLKTIQDMPSLHVKGLMCIPPALSAEEARPYFARMKELYESIKADSFPICRFSPWA